MEMDFSESGPIPSQSQIAQQIFWYTGFTSDLRKPGLPVADADGTTKWRIAPSPHGAYWEERQGITVGYDELMKACRESKATL